MNRKISIRAKRNIRLVLLLIGLACIVYQIIMVTKAPDESRKWIDLITITLLTWTFFDDLRELRKQDNQNSKSDHQ